MTAVETRAAHTALEFAAALDACHDRAEPGGVVVSPRGWVIASAALLADGEAVPGGWNELSAARRLRQR